ncbi:MAG: hypothetical protein HQM10_01200 [Candidatus Riflebacteria bacterium]|nr:hypothetical protein [Candidatus Riflebacteria bacterium]
MKKKLLNLIPFFLLFLLISFPIMLLSKMEERRLEMKLERKKFFWEIQAKHSIDLFRNITSVDSFRNKLTQKAFTLRENISENPKIQSWKDVSHDFPARINKNLFSSSVPLFAYALYLDKSGSRLIENNSFSKEKVTVMKSFLTALDNFHTMTLDESKKLDNLSRRMFGLIANFSMIQKMPGKAIPLMYNKQNIELLWDSIELKNNARIMYITAFKSDETTRSRLLKKALSAINSSFLPILVSANPGYSIKQTVLPETLSIEKLKYVKGIINKNRLLENKHKLVPSGKSVIIDETFILRDLIDTSIPYEIFLFSKIRPESSSSFVYLISCVFFTFFTVVSFRTVLYGEAFLLSLKRRFSLLFSVVGILPLLILFAAGYLYVEATHSNEERNILKNTITLMDELDAGSETVITNTIARCRKLVSDKKLLSLLRKDDNNSLKAASDKAFSYMQDHSAPIEFFLLNFPDLKTKCFFNKDSDNFRKAQFIEAVNAFFNEGFSYLTQEKAIVQVQSLVKNVNENLADFEGVTKMELFRNFMRRQSRSEIIEIDREKSFQFHDLISTKSDGPVWVNLHGNLEHQFKTYFHKSLMELEWSLNDGLRTFAATKVSSRKPEKFFPEEKDMFWQTKTAKKLYKYMIQSGNSLSTLIIPDRSGIYVSFPCRHSSGYVLSAYIYISHIQKKKAFNLIILGIFTLVLAIPVFILARRSAEYIVEPLIEVELGLFRVINGDLAGRVSLRRNDELGKVTKVFDIMTQGLERRKNLIRFVSGSLEALGSNSVMKEGVILFSDMFNFTEISEKIKPDEVVKLLNTHFEKMAECVENSGGYIENFIGDAIVSSFFQDSFEKSCYAALSAATKMYIELNYLNMNRKLQGSFEYYMGIGIDGGTLASCTIGTSDRCEHVISGEPRKNAEYLESLSRKKSETGIIISDRIARYISPEYLIKTADLKAFELTFEFVEKFRDFRK